MENESQKVKQFQTERLFLKPTSEEDALFIFQLYNSPKWLKNIGNRNVHSEDDGRRYIPAKMLPQLQRLGFSNFTVIRKADGLKIGGCGLIDREGLEGIDLGFAFLPEYEKQGYALEAALEIKRAACEDFNLKRILAITSEENFSSQKLLEKLRFKYKELVKIPGEEMQLFLYECHLEQ